MKKIILILVLSLFAAVPCPAFVIQDFSFYADENPISAGGIWESHVTDGVDAKVLSGNLGSTAANSGTHARYIGHSFNADQSAQIVLPGTWGSANTMAWIDLRMASTTSDFYFCIVTTTNIQPYKHTHPDGWTQLAIYTRTVNVGDKITFSVTTSGNNAILNTIHNDTDLGNYQDNNTTITSGNPGCGGQYNPTYDPSVASVKFTGEIVSSGTTRKSFGFGN